MKNLKLFILAVLAVSAFGCTKEEMNSSEGGSVVRTVGVTLNDVDMLSASSDGTKTTLDPITPGGTGQVIWTAGDEIGVVVKGTTTIRKGTLATGAGTSRATFTISGATESEEYSYAIYPYSYKGYGGSTAPTISGSTFTVTLPVRQPLYVENGKFVDKVFASKMCTMVGTFNGDEVNMKSTCGVLKVQLGMNAGSCQMWTLQVQSDSKKLSGKGTIDMSQSEPVVTMGTGTTSFNYVYFQPTADISKTGLVISTTPRSVYVLLPVGTYSDLQINAAAGSTSVSMNATKSHTISRSTVTPLATTLMDTKFKDKYTTFTDLCLDGSGNAAYANSYLVKPSETENSYRVTICFPAGGKTLNSPDGTAVYTKWTENVQAIFTSWESEEGLLRNLRKEGNYIYFTVKPGATGCALLSAATTSLCIRWSVLIWVSDVKEQTMIDGVVLDRDLGAGYAPSTLEEAQAMTADQADKCQGALYQWGSPIPKVGLARNSTDYYSGATWKLHPHTEGQYGCVFSASNVVGTFEKVYRYPNYFYSKVGTWNNNSGTEKVINTGTGAFWKSSAKTELDPCPVGYRIASKAVFGHAYTNFESGYGTKSYKYIYGHVGGCYCTSNSNFVYFKVCGVRLAGSDSTTAYLGRQTDYYDIDRYASKTMYPRISQWVVDDNITETELSGYTTIRYGWAGGGSDIKNETGYTDVTMPFWYALGGTVVNGSQTGTPGNIYFLSQRLFISTALPVRCMRDDVTTPQDYSVKSYVY